MSDENISIRIKDEVDPAISSKLKDIAKQATTAHGGVSKLQSALKSVSGGTGLQKLQTELAKTGLAQQKLATEISRTNEAYFKSEAALNRAIAAEMKAASATAQLAAAQNNSAIAAQRLATATAQTATASAQAQTAAINTAQAQTRAATAQTQSQIAAQGLTTATTRATTAQTQGMTAAARLAAAQTATGTATSNAAAAADRSALAALRLAQAQARAAQATQGATTSLWGYARAGAAALGIGFSAKIIIDIGDAYTILQNKLQNVTESQEQVNVLTKELFALSNRTLAGINETATAYVRFDRALKILGKSQKETLRLTETVNKALVVSGAAPQEAASALLQLSQGFNAGRLMGDEFRAVAENMPIVLDAVAKALNVPVNQLKQLASEGKITSKVLFDAFSLMQDQVDATFAKSLPTVGQAMTVAKNKAIEFFGALNKSIGFTAALSQAILFLSDNMAILSAGLAVLGSVLLVSFGPAILAGIGAVGSAIGALTVAIATNPIGLLVVGITAAIAAVTLFGDKIKVTADGLVNLQDVALAVWYYIKTAALITADVIRDNWNALINFINEKTSGWGEQFRNIGGVIISALKSTVNYIIAGWEIGFRSVMVIWEAGPAVFRKVFTDIANIAITAAEDILNHWQLVFKMLSDLISSIAPDLSKNINAALSKTKIELPRIDYGKDAEDFANKIDKIASDAFSKDYIGDAAKGIANRAGEISKARRLAEANEKNTQLRGPGEDTSGTTAGKAELKRAAALEKVNLQLDGEISRMFKLQSVREAEAKLDNFIIDKKIKLTDSERESILKKLEAVQAASEVQKQFDSLYAEAVGPANIYNDTLEAANKLVEQGAINFEQYLKAITKASESYADSADPLRQYNKELNEQFRLMELLPKQIEIEQQLMQIQNKLLGDGIILDAQQIASMKERLELLQEQSAVNQSLASIYSETQGAQLSLENQSVALDKAFAMGLLTLDQYSNRLMLLSTNMAMLKLQMGDGTFTDVLTASLGQLVTQFDGALAGMSSALGNFFQSFTDGFANSVGHSIVYWQDFGDAVKAVAKSAIADLISALVKLGLQFVINAALGKSVEAGALAAHTAMSATAAAATAAAWAPAAAMVSLASFGANSAPASAGITATAGLSQSLALASLAGFAEGGWTGNMARDEIAGVVHGKEYVMDATTTERIGVGNLAALQSGAATVQRRGQNENTSQSGGVTHKGDVKIEINVTGANVNEARSAGAAAADGYMERMGEWKLMEKESSFHKVKR